MKRYNNDLGSSREDLHGFIEGSKVIRDYDESHIHTVVNIGGLCKDDHIQLNSKKTPWMIAGNYTRA